MTALELAAAPAPDDEPTEAATIEPTAVAEPVALAAQPRQAVAVAAALAAASSHPIARPLS